MKISAIAPIATTPRLTQTPMPASAPVLSPPFADDADDFIADAGAADEIAAASSRIELALGIALLMALGASC